MNSIKHKVIFKSNQQHLKGDRHKNSTSEVKVTERLGLSMASISAKLR